MADTDTERIASDAADGARDTGGHRLLLVAVGVVFLGVLGLFAWGYVTHVQLGDTKGQVSTLATKQQAAAAAGQQLADQVRRLGAVPVVQPPRPVTAPAGQPGPAGQNGSQGPGGPSGPAGPSGAPGPTGPTGPTGIPGDPGAAGTGGQDGTNGQDGGTGPAGPAGPAGPQGDQGPQGAPGTDGAPPASWSWVDPSSGATITCTRDAGSPDDAPTYTCGSDHTTTPPTGGLLAHLGRN